MRWEFEPHDGGIRLTLQTDYKAPISAIGNLAEAVILHRNEHEV
jgi:hypothetical protein